MSPTTKNAALDILKACQTLIDADLTLQKLRPEQSNAMRWGLWDGWRGRPKSTAGVLKDKVEDYWEGVAIGQELSMRDLPA